MGLEGKGQTIICTLYNELKSSEDDGYSSDDDEVSRLQARPPLPLKSFGRGKPKLGRPDS
jgi:hypothetical protein